MTVADMEVETGVHWLTQVTDAPLNEVCTAIGGNFSPPDDRGGFGHPSRFIHESGAEVYYGSRREDQPICINVPGHVCETWADHFLDVTPRLSGRVTRVDLAADVGPPELARRRLMQMYRAFARGRVETQLKQKHQHRADDGWTNYFGARGGRLLLRVYDKRGPLRLEFEFRPHREIGAFVADDLRQRGAACMWRRLAREIVFPFDWYMQMMRGEVAEVPPAEEGESDFTRMVAQMRYQIGTRIWLMRELGMSLDDLAVRPENPRADLWAELYKLASQAEEQGYDASRVKQELNQWRRRSR